MSTIGIDYQQNLTILCLGEGASPSVRVRNVGDGLRPIIPNAVSGTELWGSRALQAGRRGSGAGGQGSGAGNAGAGGQGSGAGESSRNWGLTGATEGSGGHSADGPWLAEPDAAQFWRGLYDRLYAFLGRIPPTSQRGYRLVAGLQANNWRGASDGVTRLATQAGFAPPTCISACDALLARHLSETRQPASGESTITVVAAGDTATTVCSYRLRRDGRGSTRIVSRDSAGRSLPYGHAHWAGRLLIHITDLFTEPIQSGSELAMRDAALEFGSRLRRAPAGKAITWTGPHRDKLYAPLELTVADCSAWPEAAPFLSLLPDMIRDSAAALGGRSRPEIVLVGGIGALWPFPVAAAATAGAVLQSGAPEEDVARGAAWWPEVEAIWSDVQPVGADSMGAAPIFSTPLPDWLSDVSATVTETVAIAEPDNPFAPRDDLFGSSSVLISAAVTTDYNSERFSTFEPMGEIPESVSQMLKVNGGSHEFDLPVHTESVETEDDLENLPPWDPRRNEL